MAATGFITSPTYQASPSSQQTSAVASSTASTRTAFFAIRRHVSYSRNVKGRQRRAGAVVAMAPDDEKMTRRSPLDFPVEWDRPTPGRRPDIFPQFSPMKTPLPPPLPTDPPEEDEDEDDDKKEDDPDKEDKPDE